MTAAEITQRQQLIRAIIGSHELEGVAVTNATKRLLETFARGDVSADELVAQAQASLNEKGRQAR